METALAMQELETYECCAVPAHAWMPAAELAALVLRPRPVWRHVARDGELLGVEAIPSPALADFTLHG